MNAGENTESRAVALRPYGARPVGGIGAIIAFNKDE